MLHALVRHSHFLSEVFRVKYSILTNNPMVSNKFSSSHEVLFCDTSAKEILGKASEMIAEGDTILNHPLYGSVKPNETPYRTILLKKKGDPSFTQITKEESAELIVKALRAYEKFTDKKGQIPPEVLKDYQVVDLALASSAVESADR